MPYKFMKTSLIVLPLAVMLVLYVWNVKDYIGIYEDLIQLVLLATATIYIPTLLDGKKPLAFKWLALISAGICAFSVGLFVLTKPAYTTKEASQMLIDSGYSSIAINEDEHTGRIDEKSNFFVSKGYLYVCRKDVEGKEVERVLFNPQTGTWSVVE
ncbi:MAG: hypothetical protein IJC17_06805 [Clostridia bacterium]|nr:hypothetical protein [Clostridia bacterium]